MTNSTVELTKIWIEDLEHQPSSTLYRQLISYHKPVYNSADRFVFYNFLPVEKTTLDHVINILQYIDISPWFVNVITNQPSTKNYFESLPEPITVIWQDPVETHSVVHKVVPLFNHNNEMCAHAWAGIHVLPNGTTKLCCSFTDTLKDNNSHEFNIREHSIKQIVNSDHVKALRQEFRQGCIPAGCEHCVARERSGGTSKRQLTRFKLQNVWGNIDWESDSDHNVGFIGGHLGNLCNLKCRICDEHYSSSIATEKLSTGTIEYKKNPTYLVMLNSNWKQHSEKFFNKIKQWPQLKNFEFLGGEPLLVRENIEFMQYLVDNNLSQDCIFEFVTNGTQYHKVFDCADRFKRLTITVSIDDIGHRFEYQRSGARWSNIQANLKKFMSNTGLTMGVSITVNIQNILYLPQLIQWLLSQGINDYAYNILYYPRWISIEHLTADARDLVVNTLINSGLPPEHQKRLNFVVEFVQKIQTNNNGQEFIKNIQMVDRIRGEDFATTHPEIARVMGFK